MNASDIIAENMGRNIIELHKDYAQLALDLQTAYKLLEEKDATIEHLKSQVTPTQTEEDG